MILAIIQQAVLLVVILVVVIVVIVVIDRTSISESILTTYALLKV